MLAALVAAPLLFLAGRWIWRKIPHRSDLLPAETLPVKEDTRFPEEIAYACLNQIAKMDLPGVGALKQHYSMVTGCVRAYLEGIYGFPAMDMTTTELRSALRKCKVDAEALSLLWEVIEQADMVKFAKLRPDAGSAWGIVNLARHFVDVTKPQRNAIDTSGQDGVA